MNNKTFVFSVFSLSLLSFSNYTLAQPQTDSAQKSTTTLTSNNQNQTTTTTTTTKLKKNNTTTQNVIKTTQAPSLSTQPPQTFSTTLPPATVPVVTSNAFVPWYTGPLLAGSGRTVPKGHTNYEPYLFYTDGFGTYDDKWNVKQTQDFDTFSPTMVLTHGLTDSIDMGFSSSYDFNFADNQESSNISDTNLSLGYQLVNGVHNTWRPDVRAVIQETFPTGNYEHLDPDQEGTDITGIGSYQTTFEINTQQLWTVLTDHYLRTRLNFAYSIPTSVSVNGVNAFGGSTDTDGTENLGNSFSTDLGLEYSLTQQWVPALDLLYTYNDSSTFSGTPGTNSEGLPAMGDSSFGERFSMAPALEYNFTENLGIIAGAWFSVFGRNSSEFASGAIALNYYH